MTTRTAIYHSIVRQNGMVTNTWKVDKQWSLVKTNSLHVSWIVIKIFITKTTLLSIHQSLLKSRESNYKEMKSLGGFFPCGWVHLQELRILCRSFLAPEKLPLGITSVRTCPGSRHSFLFWLVNSRGSTNQIGWVLWKPPFWNSASGTI